MKLKRIFLFILAGISVFISHGLSFAGEVEDHAPIGVMGDHQHKKGEWMASYRYMRMDMPEHYTGTKKQSISDVHNDFVVSPVDMTMEMHMLGLMYGVSDELTLMVMVPYLIKDMEHRRRTDSKQFSTHSQGLGDVKLSGMYSLKEMTELPLHLNMGISAPTGSINRTDRTLLGPDRNLPYPMQLGSGTVDFHPGVTYLDKSENWSWGAQANSIVRFGRNEQKYKLGNAYDASSWLAYKFNELVSSSIRVKGSIWGNVDGADPRLNVNLVPTADPNLQGGERVDMFLGVNLLSHKGALKDHRLALEVGYPVYQNLTGPQLGVGLQGTVGWQKAW